MTTWPPPCPICHRLARRSHWPLEVWWCGFCTLWTLITPFSGTSNGWVDPTINGGAA